ncbi:MAG: hypothetical protein AB4426_31155 [Xenococcaceae cyanobacterium]
MTDKNPLLDAIKQVVSLKEGVAEYGSDHTLDVLLPRDIAKALKLSEEVTFTTSADSTSSYFVTYNSEIFNRFEALLGERGYVASFGVKYDGYLKNTGFEKMVLNTLSVQNGLIRVSGAKPGITPYILFNIAYTAEADEKRLGMVSFFVNGLTGVAGVEIGDALLWSSDRIDVNSTSDRPQINFEQLLNIGEKKAVQLIDTEITPWRNSLRRKLSRDESRIQAYYGAIVSEIRTKIAKKHLEGEEAEKELARIGATKMELKRKLADLQSRYTLTVKARLHSALVIWLQTVHIECELIRKKYKRSVIAVWNPYLKLIEPLRCEQSHEPVTTFYLSVPELQIISPTAWEK